MRPSALILAGLVCVTFAAPGHAASTVPDGQNPPLRYSVEEPQGPQPPQAAPLTSVEQAPLPPPRYTTGQIPPLRYGTEETPPPPLDTAGQTVPPIPAGSDAQPPPAPVSHIAQQPPSEVVVVTADTGYKLGPGDKVHVTVYGEADLTGDFEISGSGQMAFPLTGNVQAAGLSAPALGDLLAQKLAAGYLKEPRVAVEVAAYRPFYIIGEVSKPGQYPYVNGMTAVNAIALGGGYTPRASEGVIYVRHEGEVKETREAANESTAIRPGDVVRVSESGFWNVMEVLQPITGLIGAIRYGIP